MNLLPAQSCSTEVRLRQKSEAKDDSRRRWFGCLRNLVIASIITLAAGITLTANDEWERYALTQWQTGSGLPQNSVLAITQTQDGYLWLGTFNGLVRFDGVRFTSFTVANTPELQSDSILYLSTANDGTLWIGTRGGGVVSMKEGVFTHYGSDEGIANAQVRSVVCDYLGATYVLATHALYRIADGNVTQVAGLSPGIDSYLGMAVDSQNRLWVGTRNHSALEFANGELEATPRDYYSPFSPVHGNVWGLDQAAGRVRVFPLSPLQPTGPESRLNAQPADPLRFFPMVEVALEGDRVWYSGGSRRLTVVESGLHHEVHKDFFETYPDVLAIYSDREGQVWVGSDGGGLIRLRRKSVRTLSVENGFPSNNTVTVTEDHNGVVWVGHFHSAPNTTGIVTKEDGLATINHPGVPWTSSAFAQASGGGLWLGTGGGGVYRWHDASVTELPASHFAPVRRDRLFVRALLESDDGGLWIGTEGHGAILVKDGVSQHYNVSHGLSHNRVSAITEDAEKNIWVGTVNGLNQIKPNGEISVHGKEHGLGVNVIQTLYLAKDDTLFVGTAGHGLGVRHQGSFASLLIAMGTVNEVVAQILEDDFGFLWLGTNQGIVRIARNDIDAFLSGAIRSIPSTQYGLNDGMVNEECTGGYQPTCCKDSLGRLWFSTVGGIAMIDPRTDQTAKKPPSVYIEDITSFRQNSLTFARLAEGNVISIPSTRKNIEIRYTGIGGDHPEDLVFRYRMLGFDNNWQEVGTRRSAYFNQLPPGRYTFQVIANDGLTGWTPTPASIPIIVTPAWWQQSWFHGVVALAIIGLLVFVYRFRIRQLEQAQQVKTAFSRKLIQSQEDERQRISRELHDSLGQSLVVISNRAAIALQDQLSDPPVDIRDHLSKIQQTSKDATQEVRQIAQALRPVQVDRLGLTRGVEQLARQAAEAGNLEAKLTLANLDTVFAPDAQTCIWRIVQESLNNILKHAHASELEIKIAQEDKYVSVQIRDDGCGYAPNQETNRSAGIGLAGMHERAAMINGNLRVESEKGSGTTVLLRVAVPPAGRPSSFNAPRDTIPEGKNL